MKIHPRKERLAMISFFSRLSLILLMTSAAHADWQGTMTMSSPELKQPMSGKVAAKGTKLRFDMTARNQRVTTITDTKTAKTVMLMHSQKMKMETQYDATKQGVACGTMDVDGCLKKHGYKKVGSENVNKQPCDIYEGTPKTSDGKKYHQKIWRPTKLKEVAMVRAVTKMDGGKTFTLDVTDIKTAPLPDSTFAIPSDYSALPDMSKMMKGGMHMPKLPGM